MRRIKSRERLVFKALSNDVRRRLLDLLAAGERHVAELAREVESSPSLTSIHLGGLRRAGLVEARVDAKQRFYRLKGDGVVAAQAFLDHLKNGNGAGNGAKRPKLEPARGRA
ncbi:winged helix-turn-helix transcriptional regulator [bacterium]|nr:winged helix-turn-helix transcriptional regulator [bacterium]